MAKIYLGHDISVIIDQSFKSDDELKLYEELAHNYSITIYKVQLFTTPKLAFERVVHRQQDWNDKMPEDRIKRNISLFKNRKRKGFRVIDTSIISNDKVANKILKMLGVNS